MNFTKPGLLRQPGLFELLIKNVFPSLFVYLTKFSISVKNKSKEEIKFYLFEETKKEKNLEVTQTNLNKIKKYNL